jgi:light-regulated signal transduction histidine kinase (bacteriophytochrome)
MAAAVVHPLDQADLTALGQVCGIPLAAYRPGHVQSCVGRMLTRASTASGTAGSGLGLAISKAIAEAHGRTLRIVDSPGPGTTFRLAVPVTVPAGARL